ncbi:uncharacterized protein LOC110821070 isoform X3 [Carica papaya]|uniref:uncharacterized protein LOC110821070 isoform X3 n=1 Tax=Carica papaya TaxID=3649 RepID=UPI000B8D04B3|nr:uncharacterized protein LOC110821070 isoform X3 [Carica papaya]
MFFSGSQEEMDNGRVHPNCVNASNPYHECGVSCIEKISQGKGRKDVKKTDSSRGKKGELSKGKDEERRVRSSCTRASNPYHECDANCSKRTAGSDTRGIKNDSDGSHESSVGHPAKAPSPPSHSPAKKNVESGNYESFSSAEQRDGDIYSREQSFDKEQNQAPETIPIYANGTPDHHKSSPKNSMNGILGQTPNKLEKDEKKHYDSPVVSDIARSFSFLGLLRSQEDSDDEEIQSVISDSCVSVGNYHVRAGVSSILESIFDKYGDIAAGCQLESVSMRGYYLECLCSVVQELKSISFNQLTKSKVREMLAVLNDVESAKIEVEWLRDVLNELLLATELNSQCQIMESTKANCKHDLESTKKELEDRMEELAQKEKAVEEARERVTETKASLRELELEYSRLNKSILTFKSKVEKFHGKSLVDELL